MIGRWRVGTADSKVGITECRLRSVDGGMRTMDADSGCDIEENGLGIVEA